MIKILSSKNISEINRDDGSPDFDFSDFIFPKKISKYLNKFTTVKCILIFDDNYIEVVKAEEGQKDV